MYALTHQFGCSQLGEDNENIKKLLCSIALNPNASYVLFVGLGCENNGMDGIKQTLAPYERSNIEYFNCQDVADEHAYGMEILKGFIEKAKDLQREEVDFSELCIGLKCGGSDGYSGLTANPLVGKITDRIISLNGSAILTEVPEMFGAEQLLMNKCKNQEVFEKYKKMIEDFKAYYTKQGFPVYENPSPGNKKGVLRMYRKGRLYGNRGRFSLWRTGKGRGRVCVERTWERLDCGNGFGCKRLPNRAFYNG